MEKYTEHLSIKSYHTNQYGQASIASIFNILIEAAWAHAQVMDWGYLNCLVRESDNNDLCALRIRWRPRT